MPTRPKKNKRMYGYTYEKKREGYTRVRSASEYHTARWTRASKVFREAHPLCVMCEKEGIITPSEVVDHIIPYPVCQDFFDSSNWQSLCRRHNAEKGNKDKRIINDHKRQCK